MKVSLNWLKRYVDIDVSTEELCRRMTMAGFEVDGVEDLADTMRNVVAARLVKLEKHPDSDHLQICQMDVGADELVQIVTGAQNVFEGALVPAALHDSDLPCGVHIKKGKLRGVPSNGMLCSGEELCLKESDYPGAEVNGILILKEDAAPGTDMREILHLNDVIIDFSVLANRPDCQSVLGLAREVAVVLNKELKRPVPSYKTVGGSIHDHIAVSVKDFDLCPRYLGRVVTNLRVAPSPDWMQQCLKSAGMRPINNIVDITNFVMLETGQPMHAFDLQDVKGAEIIVRRAATGEQITTLDGKEHNLTDDMLVICDAESPSCIAGIMGGQESEIEDDTKALFFEAAKFRRDSVRRTGRALGIHTESSGRFEKGVDIHNTAYAMERALQLIDELDAGDIIDGTVDLNNGLPEERVLTVKAADIEALLGVSIPTATMVDILNRLALPTTEEGGVLTCRIPSIRDDIEGRADIAEEVMRIYGYDHIIGTPMKGAVLRGTLTDERRKTDRLKTLLIGQGAREITTYSFINRKAADTLLLPEDDIRRDVVALRNPLSEEFGVMRTQLFTSMLTVLATNYNRKNTAARLFETGRLFIPNEDATLQPEERPALCLGFYGEGEDFFTMKGAVELLCRGTRARFTASGEPFLHPGRQAAVWLGDEAIGVFGEVHPDVAEKYGFGVRVYVAQLELPLLFAAEKPLVRYQPLPRFPAVERDLALLCDEDLPVGEIADIIRRAGGRLLESVTLFDVYKGAQIEAGKKSVAFSLSFRSSEGTLTDEQISPAMNKIFKNLKEKDCILRT